MEFVEDLSFSRVGIGVGSGHRRRLKDSEGFVSDGGEQRGRSAVIKLRKVHELRDVGGVILL